MRIFRQALRAPLSCWVLLEAFSVATLGLLVMALIRLFTFPWDKNRVISGRIFRTIGVISIKLCPMWRFKREGTPPVSLPSPLVVVSNHASHLDPFFISFLPFEMKWLAKQSLFRLPVLGQLLRLAGDIPIVRGNKESADKALLKCGNYLKEGVSVFIFPEGTRSSASEMRPFKLGAFRLAIANGAYLLPLAITGTREALPKYGWLFDFAKGRMRMGTPIATAGLTQDDAPRVAAEAKKQVEAMLRDMKNNTVQGAS